MAVAISLLEVQNILFAIDYDLILVISDFGEDYDTLPKEPKCKDYVTSYHDRFLGHYVASIVQV